MIGEVVRALRAATTEQEQRQILIQAERKLTPDEVERIASMNRDFSSAVRQHLALLADTMRLGHPTARKFVRETIDDGIDLYSAPSSPPRRKSLVLAFTGFFGRLMTPIAVTLQYLPEDMFDIVVLNDGGRSHFLNGIGSHSKSFLELVRWLTGRFDRQAYERTFCFGTSGGGLPALRCALLLKAYRGIAVSGRVEWHIRRLLDPSEREIPAFDPLCSCFAQTEVELVCAYGADNTVDEETATRIASILSVKQLALAGIAEHNVIHALTMRGGLREFFAKIFEIER